MKFSLFAIGALGLGSVAQAESTFFEIGLIPPNVQLNTTDTCIEGLRINPLVGQNAALSGVDVGVGNMLDGNMKGVQLGLLACQNEGSTTGVQLAGAYSKSAGDMTGVQLGLFANDEAVTKGVQLGGVVAISGGVVKGAQGSFLYARADDDVKGLAIAPGTLIGKGLQGVQLGLVSVVDAKVQGAQLGLLSYAGNVQGWQVGLAYQNSASAQGWVGGFWSSVDGSVTGLQTGALSFSTGEVTGVQLSLGSNWTPANLNGLQAAIAFNGVGGTSEGVQIGIFNKAKVLKGGQIGIVNYCDDAVEGWQIGIWNQIDDQELKVIPIVHWDF